MDILTGFIFGVTGGFMSEALGFYKLRHQTKEQMPHWIRSPFYWCTTLIMMAAGGALVVAYIKSDFNLNPILALNIGASAPLLIGALGQTTKVNMGPTD